MAITFVNEGASAAPDFASETDATSYATASWTPPTSGLIYAFVSSRVSSGTANQPTGSGNGITWVAIATAFLGAATARRLTLFGANASGSSAGVTTFDFAGQTQLRFVAVFASATGVDLSGGVAAAFVQALTANGTGFSGSITLAAAGHADNRPISGFANLGEVQTPRTNWTEMDDLLVGTAYGVATQYRSDAFETTASASWASSQTWAGIAAELKATVTGTIEGSGAASTGATQALGTGAVDIAATGDVGTGPVEASGEGDVQSPPGGAETLIPNGDGTLNGWTKAGGTATYAEAVDENPKAPDNETTVIRSPGKTSDQMFLQLSDTSGVFDPTGLADIVVEHVARKNRSAPVDGEDTIDFYLQIFKSDETTALTNEVGLLDVGGSAAAASYRHRYTRLTQTGSPTKADWDGARLRLRVVYTAVGGQETTCNLTVTAIRVLLNHFPAPTDSYGAAVHALSPTHYWRMEEASGYLDDTMANRAMVPLGGAALVYGETGALASAPSRKALRHPGSNDSGAQVAGFASDQFIGNGTVCLWMKTTNPTLQSYGYLSNGTDAHGETTIGKSVSSGTSGWWGFHYRDNTVTGQTVNIKAVVNDQWEWFAYTAHSVNGAKLYHVVGDVVTLLSSPANLSQIAFQVQTTGTGQSPASATTHEISVDEIAVWHGTALSIAQLQGIYDAAIASGGDIAGSGTATTGPASASGAGTVVVSATGGAALSPATATGTATVIIAGTGAAQAGPVAVQGTGNIGAVATGEGAAVVGAAQVSGAAAVLITAAGAATITAVFASGQGTIIAASQRGFVTVSDSAQGGVTVSDS